MIDHGGDQERERGGGAPAPSPGGRPSERRRNATLRELLDEMIQLARHLSNHAERMSADELAYARERVEWLADEIWESATRGREGL